MSTGTASRSNTDLAVTIADWAAAIGARDAARVAAFADADMSVASLAPPLFAIGPDQAGLNAWFATWRTLSYDFSDYTLQQDDDLAYCYGIAHMTGTKTDGSDVDLRFRLTLCLSRGADGRWKIEHQHESVPFHMDGSLRAAVELTA